MAGDLGLKYVRTLQREEIHDMALELAQGTRLSGNLRSFARADIIFLAERNGEERYVPVEVSYTADQRDTDRAIRNAEYLPRLTGVPAFPSVACINIDNKIQSLIDSGQVTSTNSRTPSCRKSKPPVSISSLTPARKPTAGPMSSGYYGAWDSKPKRKRELRGNHRETQPRPAVPTPRPNPPLTPPRPPAHQARINHHDGNPPYAPPRTAGLSAAHSHLPPATELLFRQKPESLNLNKQIPPTPATDKIRPKQSPNRIQRATMPDRRRETINDLNLKQWRQYDDILTDSLWIQNRRDSGGAHQAGYHGNCIPQIPNHLLRRFTKPGDIVLDPFIGGGTTAVEAARLGRRYIGIELSPETAEQARRSAARPPLATIIGDSAARKPQRP